MTLEQLKKEYGNTQQAISVVAFCEEQNLQQCRERLSQFELFKHIKIVVQPCPFEGIEFLFRAPIEMPHVFYGEDTEFFWQGFLVKNLDQLNKASQAHHSFLLAILQQDIEQLEQLKKVIIECAVHLK